MSSYIEICPKQNVKDKSKSEKRSGHVRSG